MNTLTALDPGATFETAVADQARENAYAFEDALARVLDVPATGTLYVDRELVLDAAAVAAAGGTARRLSSARIADLKRWVGVQDAELDDGVFNRSLAPLEVGAETLAERAAADLPASMPDLVSAASRYLRGYAREAQAYVATLERYLGPFGADAYVLDRVTVSPSGRLILAGDRAILLQVRHLTIERGGTLDLRMTARVDTGTFERR